MKSKSIVLLAIAACCGLVAMLGIQQVLSGSNEGPPMAKVLVARADINPGVPLDETLVGFKALPVEAIPPGAVTKKEDFDQRALKEHAYPGQVILLASLGEKGQFGATINIPEGMRLATVPVDATMTHSGMMKPGDRVDVRLTDKTTKPKIGTVSRTKTLLEFIEVYATDSLRAGGTTPDGEVQAKNVSLLVTPKQANLLQLATSKGPLHLTLRNKLDDTPSQVGDIDDAELESTQALFDEMTGTDGDTPEPEPVPETPEPSFAEFAASAPVEPVEPPVKPTWQIKIYSGKEMKVEEVELPVESAEVPSNGQSATAPKSNWMSQLMRGMMHATDAGHSDKLAMPPVVAN